MPPVSKKKVTFGTTTISTFTQLPPQLETIAYKTFIAKHNLPKVQEKLKALSAETANDYLANLEQEVFAKAVQNHLANKIDADISAKKGKHCREILGEFGILDLIETDADREIKKPYESCIKKIIGALDVIEECQISLAEISDRLVTLNNEDAEFKSINEKFESLLERLKEAEINFSSSINLSIGMVKSKLQAKTAKIAKLEEKPAELGTKKYPVEQQKKIAVLKAGQKRLENELNDPENSIEGPIEDLTPIVKVTEEIKIFLSGLTPPQREMIKEFSNHLVLQKKSTNEISIYKNEILSQLGKLAPTLTPKENEAIYDCLLKKSTNETIKTLETSLENLQQTPLPELLADLPSKGDIFDLLITKLELSNPNATTLKKYKYTNIKRDYLKKQANDDFKKLLDTAVFGILKDKEKHDFFKLLKTNSAVRKAIKEKLLPEDKNKLTTILDAHIPNHSLNIDDTKAFTKKQTLTLARNIAEQINQFFDPAKAFIELPTTVSPALQSAVFDRLTKKIQDEIINELLIDPFNKVENPDSFFFSLPIKFQALLELHGPEQIKAIILKQHLQQSRAYQLSQQTIERQALAYSVLQQAIVKQGWKNTDTHRHGLQGNILTEVTLLESHYREILKVIVAKSVEFQDSDLSTINEFLDEAISTKKAKEALESFMQLNTPLTDTVSCSLDTHDTDTITRHFEQLIDGQVPNKQTILDELVKSKERSSITDLQLEFEKQLLLIAGVIENAISDLSNDSLYVIAHATALENLQSLSKAAFKTALTKSFNTTTTKINFSVLNESLDQARENASSLCLNTLLSAYESAIPGFTTTHQETLKKITDNDFSSFSSATKNAQLRTDAHNQTCVYIDAITSTPTLQRKQISHFKGEMTSDDGIDEVIEPLAKPCVTSICTITPRQGNLPWKNAHNKAVEALKDDYTQVFKKLETSTPVSYCLFTPLHKKRWGFYGTNHRQNTSRLLKSSHLFNKEQLQSGEKDALLYIQNIPTDFTSRTLTDENHGKSVLSEATLMAELSLLSLLKQQIIPQETYTDNDKEVLESYHQVQQQYHLFLQNNDCKKEYFCASKEGKKAILLLKEFKNKRVAHLTEPSDVKTQIAHALRIMLHNDSHRNIRFGALIQSFSLALQPTSLVNATTPDNQSIEIANRQELLEGLCLKVNDAEHSKQEQDFYKALSNFTSKGGNIEDLEKLQKALDKACNQHLLHGAATMDGLERTGTPSQKQGGPLAWYQRVTPNKESSQLTKLYANFSGYTLNLSRKLKIAVNTFLKPPSSAMLPSVMLAATADLTDNVSTDTPAPSVTRAISAIRANPKQRDSVYASPLILDDVDCLSSGDQSTQTAEI